MKNVFLSLLAIASLALFVPQTSFAQSKTTDKTIVEIAAGNADFSTLVAAVKAAGLAETLMGEGPFTVFAPTNKAFENLPAGLVTALLKPENKATLQKILTYHVVSGNMMAKDVVAAITAGDGMVKPTTVEGTTFSVMTKMGKVQIKDAQDNVANVVSTDIAGSNGVIHVIDRILLPADVNPAALLAQGATTGSTKTIVEIAAGNPDFSTLVAAVKAAGLAETLMGDGPFTVFAPTNKAFEDLPAGLVTALLKPENKATLQKILTYHVVSGNMMAKDVVAAITAGDGMVKPTTVEGTSFSVMTKMGKVQIKDAQDNVANVVSTDIAGSNGVIHVIDRILLPAGVNPAALLPKVSSSSMSTSFDSAGPTIAAIASSNEDFKTLTAALGAVGLVETFDSPGEYTVFAPTDAAFGALPEGTVNSLVTDQKDVLKGILAYHVIPAKITAAQLVKAIGDNRNYYLMQTLGGQTIVATIKDGNVQLIDAAGNRSTVVVTDVMASNGIIHGIDAVVMPK